MTRCHVCERPVTHDHDPYALPGHYDGDRWEVVMRNGFIVRSCQSCWMRWPDPFKLFPSTGFGYVPESLEVAA